ncbi:hypothetical protein HNQ57_000247 [Zhongshania antarctica]|uniref:Uncharacterized protein n=1 Tax=Zhongshania antarctica TaxID=641702 RepID=A0A840R007_9GAMM|nr:hypothetical protein [Zhongshania antarctica]MBB5185988.1 hypothetical protein [Zhongshania antarctica]
MIKIIDTGRKGESNKSLTSEYYRELCRRELLSSGQQLHAVLATLHKNKLAGFAEGDVRHV